MSNTDNEVLYHYTTQAGLLGILDTDCLWATHYKFLNDYTEISFAKEHLIKALLDKKNASDDIYSNGLKGVYDAFVQYDIYITSLCSHDNQYVAENGLLSQWRGYGENGGFAILFDKEKLEELVKGQNHSTEESTDLDEAKHVPRFISKKVFYDIDKYPEDFDNEIEQIVKTTMEPGELSSWEEFFNPWLICICFFKSQGFEEENEFRLAASLGRKNLKSKQIIKFRGEEISYIEIPRNINDIENDREKANRLIKPLLPIKKIIVGPHKNKDERAAWLKATLASMDVDRNKELAKMKKDNVIDSDEIEFRYSDIEITTSKTPFIG